VSHFEGIVAIPQPGPVLLGWTPYHYCAVAMNWITSGCRPSRDVGLEEDAPTSSAIPGRLTSRSTKPPREMEGRRKRAPFSPRSHERFQLRCRCSPQYGQ
jgi:hypothetical protein